MWLFDLLLQRGGPLPNGGNAKSHGNANHNSAIDNRIGNAWDQYSDTINLGLNGFAIAGLFVPGVGELEAGAIIAEEALAVNEGVNNKVDGVIAETLSNKGHITSKYTLNSDEALDAGLQYLGDGYKEIGKEGSGVFRNIDATRQFRIDNNSLSGNHNPNIPHIHLEVYKPGASKPTTNNHIPFID